MSFIDDVRQALVEMRESHQVTTWGEVTVASPLEVRIAGDTVAIRVEQKNAAYTPVVGHKVRLSRVGTQWMVDCQIGAA